MNRRSLGAFFWGFILIVIGALLLARNFGYPIPFWNLVAVYWPVIIILWGFVKLIDYYRFRKMSPPRQLFSGAEVVLLLFVIFAGSAITVGANMSAAAGDFFGLGDLVDLWSITGNNYEYSERLEGEAAAGAMIEIFNLYGNVEIRPSAGNQIIVDVRKTVRASNREEADRLVQEFTFSISPQADGRVRIYSNRDEGVDRGEERRGADRQRFRSSLTIQVPVQASLRVTNGFGATRVADVNGAHDLYNSFGDVDVRNVQGGLKIENRFGSVEAADITGNVELSTSFASATARNIDGAVSVRGSQNEVDVVQASGAVTVETSFNQVNVRDVRGPLNINTRYGDIEVSLQGPIQGDIQIESQFADVTLAAPADASFTFDLHTRFGDIDSDFPTTVDSSERSERRQSGAVGAGGPRIIINTQNGDVNLERRG